jgi:hypothetical protein
MNQKNYPLMVEIMSMFVSQRPAVTAAALPTPAEAGKGLW